MISYRNIALSLSLNVSVKLSIDRKILYLTAARARPAVSIIWSQWEITWRNRRGDRIPCLSEKLLAFYSLLPSTQTLHKLEFPWVYEFSQLLYLRFSLNLFPYDALLNLFVVHLRTWCQFSSVQFSRSVTSDFGNTMDCRKPGFPVHHQLPELTKTHVHHISDAIQPSHPLSSPSPPAFNLSQHQGLFHWVGSSHQVAKVLQFQLQHHSFQWIFRADFLYDGLLGSPCSPRASQESSPTPQVKSINSSVLSFLNSPTLTSIHEYWENHSLV